MPLGEASDGLPLGHRIAEARLLAVCLALDLGPAVVVARPRSGSARPRCPGRTPTPTAASPRPRPGPAHCGGRRSRRRSRRRDCRAPGRRPASSAGSCRPATSCPGPARCRRSRPCPRRASCPGRTRSGRRCGSCPWGCPGRPCRARRAARPAGFFSSYSMRAMRLSDSVVKYAYTRWSEAYEGESARPSRPPSPPGATPGTSPSSVFLPVFPSTRVIVPSSREDTSRSPPGSGARPHGRLQALGDRAGHLHRALGRRRRRRRGCPVECRTARLRGARRGALPVGPARRPRTSIRPRTARRGSGQHGGHSGSLHDHGSLRRGASTVHTPLGPRRSHLTRPDRDARPAGLADARSARIADARPVPISGRQPAPDGAPSQSHDPSAARQRRDLRQVRRRQPHLRRPRVLHRPALPLGPRHRHHVRPLREHPGQRHLRRRRARAARPPGAAPPPAAGWPPSSRR